MTLPIRNYCQKVYRPNPEKLLLRILKKIPAKFLVGLDEVRLFDARPSPDFRQNTACKQVSANHFVIEIYMDDPSLSGWPCFSILLFNIVFLGTITDHIIHHIRPYSHDPEMKNFQSGRINGRWAYYGIWTPLVYIIRSLGKFIRRVPVLRAELMAMTQQFLKQSHNKRDTEE